MSIEGGLNCFLQLNILPKLCEITDLPKVTKLNKYNQLNQDRVKTSRVKVTIKFELLKVRPRTLGWDHKVKARQTVFIHLKEIILYPAY